MIAEGIESVEVKKDLDMKLFHTKVFFHFLHPTPMLKRYFQDYTKHY